MNDLVAQVAKALETSGTIHIVPQEDLGNQAYAPGETHIVVRPLAHLVSFQSRVRRLVHGHIEQNEGGYAEVHAINAFHDAVFEHDKITRGEEAAIRWRNTQSSIATQVIVSRGKRAIFDPKYGFVRLVEVQNESVWEHKEELHVQFSMGYRAIASRAYRAKSTREVPHIMSYWKPIPRFEEVFASLERLSLGTKEDERTKITEVFFWGNSPSVLPPDGLIQKALSETMTNHHPKQKIRGIGLLLLKISGQGTSTQMSTLESLALQHQSTSLWLTLAPRGPSGLDPYGMSINFSDQLEESAILQHVEDILDGLDLQDDGQDVNLVLHLTKHDNNSDSFLAISFGCWTGLWYDSAHLHGEYLIS